MSLSPTLREKKGTAGDAAWMMTLPAKSGAVAGTRVKPTTEKVLAPLPGNSMDCSVSKNALEALDESPVDVSSCTVAAALTGF